MNKEILICKGHDYKVPLIGTFAFPGAEYWCPYCGYTFGMFNVDERVPATEALIGRKQIYKNYSKYYLEINGFQCCSSTKFENKRIKRGDFPKHIVEEICEFEKKHKWKYKVKALTLFKQDITEFPEFRCVDCKSFMSCELWLKEHKENCEGPCKDWERKKDDK